LPPGENRREPGGCGGAWFHPEHIDIWTTSIPDLIQYHQPWPIAMASAMASAMAKATGKKKSPETEDFLIVRPSVLQRLNVRCLLAFRASGYIERYALVLLQGLEAVRLNRREVSEQIFAAFVRGDKAKTLRIIEPFYDTSCHYNSYYS
jgi:hypothetical protein